LVGIDATDGTERWTFDLGDSSVASTGVDGTFLVGNQVGDLYALTAATGEQEWSYERDDPTFAYPTVADDLVLLSGDRYGTVEAIELGSGQRRWGVDESMSIEAVDTDDGVVFGTVPQEGAKSLDLATGDRRWEYGTEAEINTTHALGDGSVYFGDASGTVHAVDASDGTGEWTAETGQTLYRASVSGDTVLTCDDSGNLYALGTDDGDQQWSLELDAIIPLKWTATDGAVFVGENDLVEDPKMYARGLSDGSEGWTTGTDSDLYGAPALTEDTVVATSWVGTVYGFERGSVGDSGDGGQGLPGFGVGAALAGIGAGAAWYRRRDASE
jgi:outer membrane protein assembly factor BamB